MDGATLETDPMTDPQERTPETDTPSDPSPDGPAGLIEPAESSSGHDLRAEDAEGGAQSGAQTSPAAEEPVEILPQRVVEAILFASDSPMPPAKIAQVLGVGNARDVRKHISELNQQYDEWGLSFRIEEIAGGFQMLTIPAYNTWLTKLLRARQETRLSQAAMETLAIVAYKQPCTRADVEVVRGVAAGDLLNRLREMNLVKIVGRAEDLGRPLLYGTTKRFLEVFGLPSLEDLPQVEALASGAKAVATAPAAPTAEENLAAQVADQVTEAAGRPAEEATSALEETVSDSIEPPTPMPAGQVAVMPHEGSAATAIESEEATEPLNAPVSSVTENVLVPADSAAIDTEDSVPTESVSEPATEPAPVKPERPEKPPRRRKARSAKKQPDEADAARDEPSEPEHPALRIAPPDENGEQNSGR